MEIHNEDRLKRLKNKFIETRKLSLGTLLLVKEIWKDKLKEEGSDK